MEKKLTFSLKNIIVVFIAIYSFVLMGLGLNKLINKNNFNGLTGADNSIVVFADEEEVSDLTYIFETINVGGVDYTGYTVTGFNGDATPNLVIPNTYDNGVNGEHPVIAIESFAFFVNQLTSVVIPNSVISIGEHAFAGNQLTSVVIPNSVLTIEQAAFFDNELTSVEIPNSITTIAAGLFGSNQLSSVEIPSSITYIDGSAFADNQLTSIIVPDSVTAIGACAFGYNKLTSITIGSGVTSSIEWNTFIDNIIVQVRNLSGVSLYLDGSGFGREILTDLVTPFTNTLSEVDSNGIQTYTISGQKYIISYSGSSQSLDLSGYSDVYGIYDYTFSNLNLTNIILPSNLNVIREHAFRDNALTSIVIPSSVTNIGDYAFIYNALTNVVIPDSVISIGEHAFSYNSGLLIVSLPAGINYLANNVFYNGSDNALILLADLSVNPNWHSSWSYGTKAVVYNASISGDYVYSDLGNNNASIAGYLGDNVNVLEVPPVLDNGYNVVEVSGAIDFYKAKLVVLPDTVTKITSSGSYLTNNFVNLFIPDSVTTIDKQLFNVYNDSFDSVDRKIYTSHSQKPQGWAEGFNNSNSSIIFGVVYNAQYDGDYVYTVNDNNELKIEKYIGSETEVVIQNEMFGYTVTAIAEGAFSYSPITSITLPNTLTDIGAYAFRWTQLTQITIPASVENLGEGAFYNINSLQSVTFEDNSLITEIKARTFLYNNSLTSVNFGANSQIEIIGEEAFAQDPITNLVLPANLVSINDRAFISLNTITLTIPASVTTIGSQAFSSSSSLQSVIFSENSELETIGSYAFSDTNITEIIIPNSVISIGDYTFQNVTSLVSLTFESGSVLEFIGSYAFNNTRIVSVEIPNSVNYLGNYAFANNNQLQTLTFEEDAVLETINDYAFYYNNLVSLLIPASVKTIGQYTFVGYNNNISTLEFEENSALETIGQYAFASTGFNSVVLPNTVATIYRDAFYPNVTVYTALSTRPESWWRPVNADPTYKIYYNYLGDSGIFTDEDTQLRYIVRLDGDVAIVGYEGEDTELTIPAVIDNKNVIAIYDRAITSMLLTKIIIEDGVKFIGSGAFATGYHINNSILIPSSVETIEEYAFEGNTLIYTSLSSKPAGWHEYMGGKAIYFNYSGDGEVFEDVNGLLYIVTDNDEVAIVGYNGSDTSIQIPLSIESKYVVAIYDAAFDGLNTIQSVSIGARVKYIGKNAFRWLYNLTSLTFASGSQLETIEEGAFYGLTSLTQNLILPSGVKTIGNNAFQLIASNIIYIPASVETLGNTTFANQDNSVKKIFVGHSSISTAWHTNLITNLNSQFNNNYNIVYLNAKLETDFVKTSADGLYDYYLLNETDGDLDLVGIIKYYNLNPLTIVEVASEIDYLPVGLIATNAFANLNLSILRIPEGIKYAQNNIVGTSNPGQFKIYLAETSKPENWHVNWNGGVATFYGLVDDTVYTSGYYQYMKTVNNEAIITGYNSSASTLNIPNNIDGYTVVAIGANAFASKSINNLTIPNTVKTIGNYAFYDNYFSAVVISSGSQLETIGDYAFARSSSYNNIKYFLIPNSVTYIGQYAFSRWMDVTLYVQQDSSSAVSWSSNWSYNQYTGPYLVRWNVLVSGNYAYSVTEDDEVTLLRYIGSDLNVVVPAYIEGLPVTTIAGYAFDNQQFTSLTFESGIQLKSIESYAFKDIWGDFKSISLPEGIETISIEAFFRSSSQIKIYVKESTKPIGWHENWYYDLNNYMTVFYGVYVYNDLYLFSETENSVIIIEYLGSETNVQIPGLVNDKPIVEIGALAFYQNTTVQSVIIPSSVVIINEEAFAFTSSLASVIFESGSQLTTIGSNAFREAVLTSIELPDTLITIGVSAFGYNRFTTLILPNSVTTIGNYAFQQSITLTKIIIPSSVSNMDRNVFAGSNVNLVIYVGHASKPSGWHTNWNYRYSWDVKTFTTMWGVKDFGSTAEYDYLVNVEDKAIILKYNGSSSSVTIPSTIGDNNYEVVEIGVDAFRDKTTLTSVTIPNGITAIGNNAFRSTQITSVNIPNSIITIGEYAFAENNQLTSVTFAEGSQLLTIGDYAFRNNRLVNVTIPTGVTTLGNYAFANNSTALIKLFIPSSVITVGQYLIQSSNSVSVYTPHLAQPDGWNINWNSSGRPVYWGVVEFSETADFEYLVNSENKAVLLKYLGSSSSVVIPTVIGSGNYEVVEIGANAFLDKTNLTSITIPNEITAIGSAAFRNTRITSVNIPNSIITIGEYAFAENNQLTSVTFAEGSQLLTIGVGAFANINLSSMVIPASVTTIGQSAFSNNSNLTSMTFAEGSQLQTIGSSAFSSNNLSSIIIPVGVTNIGDWPFQHNYTLTSVVFAEGSQIQNIGNYFLGYTGVTSITIPASVTSISQYTFDYANNLTQIFVDESNPNYSSINGVLYNKAVTTLMRYPYGASHGVLEIPEFVTTINSGAISPNGSTRLVIYIPSTVTTIGDSAITGTTSVTFLLEATEKPEGWNDYWISGSLDWQYYSIVWNVKDFGNYDNFEYAVVDGGESDDYVVLTRFTGTYSSPTNINIPAEIEGYAVKEFSRHFIVNYNSIINLTIPSSVTTINYYAFRSNSSSSSYAINISTSLTEKPSGWDANWHNYPQLVTVNYGVQSENGFTFSIIDEDNKLAEIIGYTGSETNLEIPSTVLNGEYSIVSIGTNAFYNKNLASVTIPASVISIGVSAFESNYTLSNLTFAAGSQLQAIGNNAFRNTAIENLIIPSSVETIGDYAFAYNQYLKMAIIPISVTYIGDSAFYLDRSRDSTIYVEAAEPNANWHYNWSSGAGTIIYGVSLGISGNYMYNDLGNNEASVLGYLGVPVSVLQIPYTLDNGYAVVELSGSVGFSNVSNLLILPNSITRITSQSTSLFSGSTYVRMYIPSSVTEINVRLYGAIMQSQGRYIYTGHSSKPANWVNDFNSNDYSTLTVVYNAQYDGDYLFSLSDSNAVIQRYVGTVSDLAVADTVGGYTVTGIANYAFYNNFTTTKIKLPSTITSIGGYAFANDDSYLATLTQIFIPSSVTTMGDYAFSNPNYNLTIFSEHLSQPIGWGYWNPNSRPVYWGVKDAGATSEFQYAVKLNDEAVITKYLGTSSSVVIPNTISDGNYTVVEIGVDAFRDKTNLTSITLPNSLTIISDYAFYRTRITSVVIPSSVTSIGFYAFASNSQLTSVTFAENSQLYGIGANAFAYSNIRQVFIPITVQVIQDYVFRDIYNSNFVIYAEAASQPANWYSYWNLKNSWTQQYHTVYWNIAINGDFLVTNLNENDVAIKGYIGTETNLLIPGVLNGKNVVAFGDGSGVTSGVNIKSLTLAEGVTQIGANAFANFTKLQTLNIPSTINSIGENAFAGTYKLVQVRNLSGLALSGLDNLDQEIITDGSEFTSVISEVDVNGVITFTNNSRVYLYDYELLGVSGASPLDLTAYELYGIYDYATYNNNLFDFVYLPEGLEYIGAYSLNITGRVIMPTSVTTIKSHAFCSNSTSNIFYKGETIPAGFEEGWNLRDETGQYYYSYHKVFVNVLNGTVYEDSYISYTELNDGTLLVIGTASAWGNTINIPSQINSKTVYGIADRAFAGIGGILSVVIPNTVTYIGDYAFIGMYDLTSILLPATVTTVGRDLFANNNNGANSNLKIFVAFEENEVPVTWNENWNNGVTDKVNYGVLGFISSPQYDFIILADNTLSIVAYKGSTQNLTIIGEYDGKVVSRIGKYAFSGLQFPRDITIPASIKIIDDYAFSQMQQLRNITFAPNSQLEVIGNRAFEYNTNWIKNIVIPASVKTIGDYAFSYVNLQSITFEAGSQLESIGNYAFAYNDDYLSTITLPYGLKTIGEYAFAVNNSYSQFTTIFLPATIEYAGYNIFGYNSGIIAYVGGPQSISEEWDEGWNPYEIPVYWNVSSLGSDGTYNYVILSDEVSVVITKYIGGDTYILIPTVIDGKNVVGIGSNAFSEMGGLYIYIPLAIENIEQYAFGLNSGNIKIFVESEVKPESWHNNWMYYDAYSNSGVYFNVLAVENINEIIINFNGEYDYVLLNETIGDVNTIAVVKYYNPLGYGEFTVSTEVNGHVVRALGSYSYAYLWLTKLTIPEGITYIYDYLTGTDNNLNFKIFVSEETQPETWSGNWNHGIATFYGIMDGTIYSWNNYEYMKTSDSIIIVGYTSYGPYNLQIPGYIESLPVRVISDNAFRDKGLQGTLTIPNTITTIGSYAFAENYNLEFIAFEENSQLEAIGSYAFTNIHSYSKSIVIPASVKSIGSYAFASSAITGVTFETGSQLETIGSYAFSYNYNLSAFIIPTSVTFIDSWAFESTNASIYTQLSQSASVNWGENWNSYRPVYWDALVEGDYFYTIVNDTYVNITMYLGSNTELAVPSSLAGLPVQTIADNVFRNKNLYGTLTIPNTIISIGSYAFTGNYNLEFIVFEENSQLETIGTDAFSDISNYAKSIVIPSSVKSIGSYAFASSAITGVTFETGSQLETIGSYAFSYNNNLSSFIIPTSVTFIGSYAFRGMYNLSIYTQLSASAAATWSSSWNRIFAGGDYHTVYWNTLVSGNYMYSVTDNTYVTIVQYIGTDVNVEIPDMIEGLPVQVIGENSFEQIGLQTVYIPASVVTIGYGAFRFNPLTSVTFESDSQLQTISSEAFWENQLSIIAIPLSVSTIGDYAFANPANNIIILAEATSKPEGWSNYWNYKYSWDSQIFTTIWGSTGGVFVEGYILQTLTETTASIIAIDMNYFGNSNLIIPSQIGGYTIVGIGNEVFTNYYFMQQVTIPNTVKFIGNSAFANLNGLYMITFASNSQLETIGSYAFANLGSLQSVTIPASVKSIGNSAFAMWNYLDIDEGYANLNHSFNVLNFGANSQLQTIGHSAFWGLGATQITLPASLISIGPQAFAANINLQTVNFSDLVNLQSIGHTAFMMTKLTSVTLPASVETVGSYAFNNDYDYSYLGAKVETVYVLRSLAQHGSITSLGEFVFGEDSGVSVYVPYDSLGAYASDTNWSLYNVNATVKLAVDDKYMTFGDELPEFTYKILDSGDNDITANFNVSGSLFVSYNNAVGTYLINTSNLYIGEGYQIIYVDGYLYVTAREITINWSEELEFVYNKTTRVPSAYATGFYDEELTLNISGGKVNVGTYTATATVVGTNNYIITNNTIEFTIVPAQIVINGVGVVTKVYDGTISAEITVSNYDIIGVISGDNVTITSYLAEYNSKNVFEANMVTVSDMTLSSANYTFIGEFTITGAITPAQVAVVWGALRTFTYNKQLQAPTASVNSGIIGDEVIEIMVSGAQTDVGTYTATALVGENSNYTLTNITVGYSITPKAIEVFGTTGVEKVYDGTVYATLNNSNYEFLGVIEGDIVILQYVAQFTSVNVENNLTVVVNNLAISNNNYSLTTEVFEIYPSSIIPKALMVTWSNLRFEYDGQQHVPTASVITGINNETLNIIVELINDSTGVNIGTHTVLAVIDNSSSYASNYTLINSQKEFIITQKSITIESVGSITKQYDGTILLLTPITGDNYNLIGIIDGDVVAINYLATFNSKNAYEATLVRIYNITLTGNDSENYKLDVTEFTISASILPKEIVVEWSNLEMVFNNAVQKPTAVADTGIVGETIQLNVVASGKNVGTHLATAEVLSISSNYTLLENETNYEITPREVEVEWNNLTLTFNNQLQKPTARAFELFGGAEIMLQVSGDRTNAGTYDAIATMVTPNNNYVLVNNQKQFTIAPKAILIAAGNGVLKVYDGNTSFNSLTSANYGLQGIISGDIVTVASYTAEFNSQNVALANYVTVSNIVLSSSNYVLTNSILTLNASIIAKDITVGWSEVVVEKTYDGTKAVTLQSVHYQFIGLVGADSVVLNNTAEYTDKNAGNSNVVVSNLSITNANYNLTTNSFYAIGLINKKQVTVVMNRDVVKTVGAVDPEFAYSVEGIISGETLNGRLTRQQGNEAGSYDILPGTLTDEYNGNYIISYELKKLVIVEKQTWLIYVAVGLAVAFTSILAFTQVVLNSKKKRRNLKRKS